MYIANIEEAKRAIEEFKALSRCECKDRTWEAIYHNDKLYVRCEICATTFDMENLVRGFYDIQDRYHGLMTDILNSAVENESKIKQAKQELIDKGYPAERIKKMFSSQD